jgi:Asp-tRNA(Asn)/Glu-tRNA(Gln) amidotransferase A subunit family amidase
MVSNNELLELTSVEMRRRIGTKEISPVELLEASIARIEALNPAVNAIAATDFATARKLRSGSLRFVRRLPSYYGRVRLLAPVHHRLRLLVFPMRTANANS